MASVPPECPFESFTFGDFKFVELAREFVGALHRRERDEVLKELWQGRQKVRRDGGELDGVQVCEGSIKR